MQQPTEHIPAKAILTGVGSRDRCPLLNALVRTCLVVERNVFDQHAAQMAFAEDQKMIETLFTEGSDPALGKGIGFGSSIGRPDDLNAYLVPPKNSIDR
jgi:hypothetical protein